MLHLLYKSLLRDYAGQVHPANSTRAYNAWSFDTNRLVGEYLDQGGSWKMIREVDYLAEKNADWLPPY